MQLTNLFPATLKNAAQEIFGEPSMQPVLLGLLPATGVDANSRAEAQLRKLLHPNELAILDGYRFAKRRREYLTGRICAKKAIQDFFCRTRPDSMTLPLPEIEIMKTAQGRPAVHLQTPLATIPGLDISISHSGEYGAALAAGAKCGIDLQKQEASLLRVQERYCSEDEYSLLKTCLAEKDAAVRLALVWAAKEAAKKALSHWQMPGFLELELWRLQTDRTDCIAFSLRVAHSKNEQMPKEVIVVADLFDGYALAICLVKEDRSNA